MLISKFNPTSIYESKKVTIALMFNDFLNGKKYKSLKEISRKLGQSYRHVRRQFQEYKKIKDDEPREHLFVIHKAKNKISNNHLKKDLVEKMLEEYCILTCKMNRMRKIHLKSLTHKLFFQESKTCKDNKVSYSTVNHYLNLNEAYSPRSNQKVKTKYRKIRAILMKKNEHYIIDQQLMKEVLKITKEIEAVKELPIRLLKNRVGSYGTNVEIDACVDAWINDEKFHIYTAKDSYTNKTLALYAEKEETNHGYIELLKRLILRHGVPETIKTDNRMTFTNNRDLKPTLIGNFINSLGCQLRTSSEPTFKPSVERSFSTMQNRLFLKFAQWDFKDWEDINKKEEQIIDYINSVSRTFPVEKNCFRECSIHEFKAKLIKLEQRKVLSGNCISFNNKFYAPFNVDGKRILMKKKGYVTVKVYILDNRIVLKDNGLEYDLHVVNNDPSWENDVNDMIQKENEIQALKKKVRKTEQENINLHD